MRKILQMVVLGGLAFSAQAAPTKAGPDWRSYAPAVFEQAAREDKFVFIYLEAVWCHWCHVMQQDTLIDDAVLRKLDKHYLSVRVDHDANPLLANRYRDWGWPALIFLAADGTEIVKRAGYIAPQPFARLLDAIVADPSPEAADVAARYSQLEPVSALEDAARAALWAKHEQHMDRERGGLSLAQKFVDANSLELNLRLGAAGKAEYRQQAQRTLDAARALIDPVWGGAYQYSTGGRWDRPHYEKIMRSQAKVLRAYALAYAQWQRPADRDSAEQIVAYLLNFLRDPASGAFYVSQDADLVQGQKAHDYFQLDDAARRARGMPRIDRNRYASSNGQAVEALALWAAVSGDAVAAQAAGTAARWVEQHLTAADGGYRHGSDNQQAQYLADNLAMAQAHLALYQLGADRGQLQAAVATADFIGQHFAKPGQGFVTAMDDGGPIKPVPVLAENFEATRFFNLLAHFSGQARHSQWARDGLGFLLSEPVRSTAFEEAGVLLVDRELASDPLHLVVVGAKADPEARQLYQQALKNMDGYTRIEWWDRSQGPLPNNDVAFPEFERAAGYVCTAQRCSAPSFEAARYAQQIARLTGAAP